MHWDLPPYAVKARSAVGSATQQRISCSRAEGSDRRHRLIKEECRITHRSPVRETFRRIRSQSRRPACGKSRTSPVAPFRGTGRIQEAFMKLHRPPTLQPRQYLHERPKRVRCPVLQRFKVGRATDRHSGSATLRCKDETFYGITMGQAQSDSAQLSSAAPHEYPASHGRRIHIFSFQ